MKTEDGTDVIIDNTAEEVANHPAIDFPAEWLQKLLDYHRKHAQTVIDVDSDGGMVLTELPHVDLAMLEVRFHHKSSIGLYSREEANAVADCILRALGLVPATRH